MKNYDSPWMFTIEEDNDHLYRAIPKASENLARKFMDLNVIQYEKIEMETNGLRHNLSNIDCSIYKTKKLPFQIRIQETTRTTALEIISYLIDLQIDCMKNDMALLDINESNVLYWNKPLYVDMGSAIKPTAIAHANSVARIAYLYNKYINKINVNSGPGQYSISMMSRDGGIFKQIAKSWDKEKWSKTKSWEELKYALLSRGVDRSDSHWSREYAKRHTEHDTY